jgi:hypothetical protein
MTSVSVISTHASPASKRLPQHWPRLWGLHISQAPIVAHTNDLDFSIVAASAPAECAVRAHSRFYPILQPGQAADDFCRRCGRPPLRDLLAPHDHMHVCSRSVTVHFGYLESVFIQVISTAHASCLMLVAIATIYSHFRNCVGRFDSRQRSTWPRPSRLAQNLLPAG